MSRRPRSARPDDDGQVMLLVLVYALICLALVSVVVAASAVHLARHRLQALADAAALDAADALNRSQFYAVDGSGGVPASGRLPTTDAAVRAGVTDYLAAAPAAQRFSDLTVLDARRPAAGDGAEVTLRARVELPWVTSVLDAVSGGITVDATATARTRVLAP